MDNPHIDHIQLVRGDTFEVHGVLYKVVGAESQPKAHNGPLLIIEQLSHLPHHTLTDDERKQLSLDLES